MCAKAESKGVGRANRARSLVDSPQMSADRMDDVAFELGLELEFAEQRREGEGRKAIRIKT